MTVEEMINFETQNCITQISKGIEAQIIDGVYTVSQKAELDFNEEEIKKMLLMFKPMQEELRVYKKALELISEDCCNPLTDDTKTDLIDYYLQKAREQNND